MNIFLARGLFILCALSLVGFLFYKEKNLNEADALYESTFREMIERETSTPPKINSITNIYSISIRSGLSGSYSGSLSGYNQGIFMLGFGSMAGETSGNASGQISSNMAYYFYIEEQGGYLLRSVSAADTILIESDTETPCYRTWHKIKKPELVIPKGTIKKEFKL